MARPRSDKIAAAKLKLLSRLEHGFYRPGDRFLSARAISAQLHISYQSADRLIRELATEGRLERRPASGTYIPGKADPFSGVCLMFHPRARRHASFGSRLHGYLQAALERDDLQVDVKWSSARAALPPLDTLPILWESTNGLDAALRSRRPAILINDEPNPGLAAMFVDSIAINDFAGGAMAADLLHARVGTSKKPNRFMILAGPPADHRSNARVAGFKSRFAAGTRWSETWFYDAGYYAAPQIMNQRPSGVFCCNDRLAEALISWCRAHHVELPAIVGFDDAPVAESLGLTTIAIPWNDLSRSVCAAVARRRQSPTAPAVRQVLSPVPIIRWA